MSNRSGARGDEWWVEGVGFEANDLGRQGKKERTKMARGKLYVVLTHYGYKEPKGFGKQWVRCPFHADTHASAAVDWDTNYFTCFACEMKGTAIDLVMKKEGIGLDDAVRRIELY